MANQQIEVQIMGQSYLLGAPEGGAQLLRNAVSKVDAAMCKIRDAGKVKARDRIAVLAALNLAFDAVGRSDAETQTAFAQTDLHNDANGNGNGYDDPRLAAHWLVTGNFCKSAGLCAILRVEFILSAALVGLYIPCTNALRARA
jgi:cell division protein ZapA